VSSLIEVVVGGSGGSGDTARAVFGARGVGDDAPNDVAFPLFRLLLARECCSFRFLSHHRSLRSGVCWLFPEFCEDLSYQAAKGSQLNLQCLVFRNKILAEVSQLWQISANLRCGWVCVCSCGNAAPVGHASMVPIPEGLGVVLSLVPVGG
jgi:hypothetical protein